MTKRIFNAVLLVAAVVLVLSFLAVMDVLYGYFTNVQEKQLETELSLAAHGVEAGGTEWLSDLSPSGYRLTLVGGDGTVLFDSGADAAGMENHGAREEISEALTTGAGASERMSATMTEKTVYRAVRLSDGTVLRISITQNSVMTLLLGMLTPMLAVLAVAILLSAALAGRLAKRIVKPLNSLDLEHPLDNDAYGELSPLLNRIAAQRREIEGQLTALKRRQDEFSAITGSMNEGLVLLNERGAIVSINPAAQRLFHADAGCVGRDFLTVERSREIELAVKAALDEGHGEATVTRDGRRVEIDTSCIRSGGQAAGTVLLAFDVTERAEAEKLRREFTANVSHELKTPLQTIMGSAELMENGLVKPEDVPRFTGHIRQEAARLVSLIDDIIRLSRLDEGENPPAEPVDLLPVAEEAAGQLAEAAKAGSVRVTVTGGPAVLRGVPRLLHEIAYNLIDNAIRYNRPGGSVEVRVGMENGRAVLTVSDTGIGIQKAHQGRVFERFYRVDKSHSKSTGGTGLGLSIVKHAAEAMRGEITLESEPGAGTVITVAFPAGPRA